MNITKYLRQANSQDDLFYLVESEKKPLMVLYFLPGDVYSIKLR
jgi:hypothetical protein